LVLFTSLLILNRSEVVQAIEITQSDITYTLDYQDEQGSWHNITSSGGATVGYISREYRLRFRFQLPQTMQLGQPYDINFTLNHQSSNIRGINLTVGDYNGTILSTSTCTYDSLSTQSNNSLTRTTFNIYGFKCNTSAWVTLSFAYYSDSSPHPSQAGSGVISAGIVGFSITDSSTESILIKWQQSLSVQINDMISAMDSVTDAVEHEETSILGGLVDLGSDILGGLGDLGSDLLDGINSGINSINGFFDDLEEGLLGGINDAINSINGFFDDLESALLGGLTALGEFLIDGVYDLFVPSADDLQDWIEGLQDDIEEECPLIGDILSIFTNLVDMAIAGEQVTSFHIPSVTLEFGDDSIIFGNWDVPLLPEGWDDYIDYVRLFTSIIVGLGFINMMYHRILNILGIETADESNEAIDYSEGAMMFQGAHGIYDVTYYDEF